MTVSEDSDVTATLENRVAIVTGGANGIGRAIAARLIDQGASVALADHATDDAIQTADELGPRCLAVTCDVTDKPGVDSMVASIIERLGHLDILVNNAGIHRATALEDVGTDGFGDFARVMVDGTFHCCRAAAEHLAKSDCARILNIASIEGLRGKTGSLAYGTAKGAVVNLTRELACELARRGINVNAIAPGFIDTAMCILPDGSHHHDTPLFRNVYIGEGFIPLRRDGKPDDIAGPAAFLCGPDSAYVTGQILCVDGGLSATY